MNISRKSFHYKIHRFWMDTEWHDHMTLCYYFWTVVGGILKALFITAIVSVVMLGLGLAVYLHPIIVAAIIGIIAATVGAFYVIMQLKRVVRHVDKSDSLVLSYIAAKKNKFCPIIKFKD